MNKFSKFSSKSPNPSINNGDPQQQSNEISSNILDEELNNVSGVGVGQPKPSWYHQVRGKIEEKYTEYKNEKDMKRLQNESLNFDSNLDDLLLDDDENDDNENEFAEKDDKFVKTLSHSFSDDSIPVKESDEMNLGTDTTVSRNLSFKFIQIFTFFLAGRRSSTPASADDIHQGSAPQTPQERRRFGFGKYFERSNKADRTNTASSNDVNADISTPKSGKKPKT